MTLLRTLPGRDRMRTASGLSPRRCSRQSRKARFSIMAEKHSTVEYRDVPGFPGYRVGDDGSVWSRWHNSGHGNVCMVDQWRKLRPGKPDKKHYAQVTLTRDGRHFMRSVHRLVLESFVGPDHYGLDTRHLDDNRENNQLSNLVRGTRKENMADAVRNGKWSSKGERNPQAKMSVSEVKAIRLLLSSGWTVAELSRRIGRPYSTIQNIKTRIRWGGVA